MSIPITDIYSLLQVLFGSGVLLLLAKGLLFVGGFFQNFAMLVTAIEKLTLQNDDLNKKVTDIQLRLIRLETKLSN